MRNHSSSNHNMMNRLIERRRGVGRAKDSLVEPVEWFSVIVIISILWTVVPHRCGQMATHSSCVLAFLSRGNFVCDCYWLIFINIISFTRHAFFVLGVHVRACVRCLCKLKIQKNDALISNLVAATRMRNKDGKRGREKDEKWKRQRALPQA